MKRHDVTIGWSIAEDEAEDEEAWLARQNGAEMQAGKETESTGSRVRNKEQLMALLVVALVLLLGGGWFWHRRPAATQTGRELQTVLNQEARAQKVNSEPIAHAAAMPSGSVNSSKERAGNPAEIVTEAFESGERLASYRQVGDHVMAQVTANYPIDGAMQAYRETRFYQRSQDSWQRIDPDPLLLGADKTLQIAHFVILYKEVDADAVYATAPKLEQLYAKLERVLALPLADSTSTYTIEVVTDKIPSGYNFGFSSQKLQVPSPTLLSVPAQMTAATILYQSMVYPLARKLVMEAVQVPQYQVQYGILSWRPTQNALTLWLLWDDGGPLATGREEVVRWVYQNSQSDERKEYTPLPDGYALLCRTYRMWAITPRDVFIPLFCNDGDKRLLLTHDYADMSFLLPLRLNTANGNDMDADLFTRTVLTETVIEYIVATYGPERMRRFVTAIGDYESLDTLIPPIFNVSPSEFEAGWRAYLAQHY
jgi:hypothetical protein